MQRWAQQWTDKVWTKQKHKILRRDGNNTQKNYTKKILMIQITPWILITQIAHLEPDTTECEVKQALGSITTNKVSGGDGIPAELFQVLKDDAVGGGTKMAEEQDGDNTFSPTNSSKEHLNAE